MKLLVFELLHKGRLFASVLDHCASSQSLQMFWSLLKIKAAALHKCFWPGHKKRHWRRFLFVCSVFTFLEIAAPASWRFLTASQNFHVNVWWFQTHPHTHQHIQNHLLFTYCCDTHGHSLNFEIYVTYSLLPCFTHDSNAYIACRLTIRWLLLRLQHSDWFSQYEIQCCRDC